MKNLLNYILGKLHPLVHDADALLSMGRISYWVVFTMINAFWIAEKMVPDTMTTILMALLSYEVFKKGRDVYKEKSLVEDEG